MHGIPGMFISAKRSSGSNLVFGTYKIIPCFGSVRGRGGVVGVRGDAEEDVRTFIYLTSFITVQKLGPSVCQFSQSP